MEKSAIIFGSTGLVGSALLHSLLDSNDYKSVKIFVRKTLPLVHPKLEQIIIDFDQMDVVADKIKGDHIFLCLGTTMAKAGSKEAFYKVDFTYTLRAAQYAAANKVSRLCLISSLGADSKSSIYYSKVKGEIESAISELNFEAIHILRPSLLLGDRKESRIGERIAVVLSKSLSFLFVGPLATYKAIYDTTVAKALIFYALHGSNGLHIHESKELQNIH